MINCIIVDTDKTARKTIESIIKEVKHLYVVKTCATLADASEIFLEQPVHVLFLDVPRSGEDGIGFLDDLKYGRP